MGWMRKLGMLEESCHRGKGFGIGRMFNACLEVELVDSGVQVTQDRGK
mgnify:CR=1 FL=1